MLRTNIGGVVVSGGASPAISPTALLLDPILLQHRSRASIGNALLSTHALPLQVSDALVVVLCAIYALFYVLLLSVCTADSQRVLRIELWFAWHVFFIMLLLVNRFSNDNNNDNDDDGSPTTTLTTLVPSLAWHRNVRVMLASAASMQCCAFAIWSTVLWSSSSNADDSRSAEFYGLAAAILYCMTLIALFIVYTSARARR
jgi:hypothetical protein